MITDISLEELKKYLVELQSQLTTTDLVLLDTYVVNQKIHNLYLSDLFCRNCLKGKVWLSNEFLITLKNAKYGIEEERLRSKGGKDGIFLLDRKFKPQNAMQTKIFNKFIDSPNSKFLDYAKAFPFTPEETRAIRIVSHHMRLLGLLFQKNEEYCILLVDYDNTK